jgi:hypothetical protein
MLFKKRTLCAHQVGVWFVNFVYCNDKRCVAFANSGERFERLRFYAIVRCDDKNCDVCDIRAARADCLERGVAGRVNKGDAFLYPELRRGVVHLVSYFIRRNVLGYATSFTRNNVCFSNVIKECGFTVIHVTHHNNNWRSFV